MDRFRQSPHPDPHPPKLAHPLGTVVFCIHCFRTLGTESAETPRQALLTSHKCAESLLAKQPAAPPPYN
jgi:hypothetical protein